MPHINSHEQTIGIQQIADPAPADAHCYASEIEITI
jgi:hypothetical protein